MGESNSHYVAKFEQFFNSYYKQKIERLAEVYPEQQSLLIDYPTLERYEPEVADELREKPYVILESAEEALKSLGLVNSAGVEITPRTRIVNMPQDANVPVKHITSHVINKFIGVEGVATKVTDVKPRLITAVFQCTRCDRIYTLHQNEQTGRLNEPKTCTCENKTFNLLEDHSTFIDTQKIEVQEPLEQLRGGEQAKMLTCWLEADLTNKITPGDKLLLTGTVRLQNPKFKGSIYEKYLDTNSVTKLEREFEEIELTKEEQEKIIELSKDPDLYKKIVASIAPSIYGHSEIKEAIALQLFGGTPGKITPDGMKIRPDMHLLLIGDPGVAKSRLLQYVTQLAPKGIYVSGKSSSAAGLTASAEKDDFGEGGWVLKAGALVLSAGGQCSIDEFDKMGEEDRSSMHEAMETQQIHVAKAGIVATFKANTAILAAANPKYGRFDPYGLPAEQFNITPTILSRFDLIFTVRDVLDSNRDRELAEKILTTHQKAAMHQQELDLQGIIDTDFLRRYIGYARKEIRPILGDKAKKKMLEFYVNLRKLGEKQNSIPITARQLEGVIRLAEASAKGRLSKTVDVEDADRAIKLTNYYMKEVGVDPDTGQLDVDIVFLGTSKSRVDRTKNILRIIKKLSQEFDEVKTEMIIEEAKTEGLKEEDIENVLSELRKNGEVYMPRHGVYKPAEQR
ncbi:MAG: minichromosome maintenance protein MCM [DPANN group archaeon]|nr:minichromosome maintenance protein MCM [DPANN group archaeon]